MVVREETTGIVMRGMIIVVKEETTGISMRGITAVVREVIIIRIITGEGDGDIQMIVSSSIMEGDHVIAMTKTMVQNMEGNEVDMKVQGGHLVCVSFLLLLGPLFSFKFSFSPCFIKQKA